MKQRGQKGERAGMNQNRKRKTAIIMGGGLALAGAAALGLHLLYRMIVRWLGSTGWIFDVSVTMTMLVLMAALAVWMLVYDARHRPSLL